MLMVIIAVAMAVILAAMFEAAQSTSIGVFQNIANHDQARCIAEKALQTAVKYTQTHALDANCRTLMQTNWTGGTPAEGGFTLRAQDGQYVNGVLQGDGSLTNNTTDNVTLTAIGKYHGATHVTRCLLVPTATGGGFIPGAVAVANTISLTGNTRIDAMDSSQANYNPNTNYTGALSMSTNTTAADAVKLTGSSTIAGNLAIGSGGNVNTVIKTTGTAAVTGTKTAQSNNVSLPSITAPSGLPASAGNTSYLSWGDATLTAGTYHYNNFSLSGSLTLTVSGNVTIYCDSSFSLSGSTAIKLASGATLTIYTPSFDMSGSTAINSSDGSYKPTQTMLYYSGNNDIRLGGSVDFAGQILAPSAGLDLSGNSRVFGSIMAQSLDLSGSAKFTQDLALVNQGGGGGGGGSATVSMVWSEQP